MNIKTKIGNHTFELRNIQVCEFMSEETTAFLANVFIDGIKVGYCENNGKGEGNYPMIDTPFRELYEKVANELSNYHYHEDNYYGREIDWNYSMDFLIGMMIEYAYNNGEKVYHI